MLIFGKEQESQINDLNFNIKILEKNKLNSKQAKIKEVINIRA